MNGPNQCVDRSGGKCITARFAFDVFFVYKSFYTQKNYRNTIKSVPCSVYIHLLTIYNGIVPRGLKMPEYEALAKNLKKIRKEKNETQFEFASNCGVSEEEISLMERKKTDPKLSTLQNIAAYTSRTVSDLLKVENGQ